MRAAPSPRAAVPAPSRRDPASGLQGELRSGAVEPVVADRSEADRPHRAEMHGNGVVGVELGQEAGGAHRIEVPGTQPGAPATDR